MIEMMTKIKITKCKLVKKAVKDGEGYPKIVDSKCEGYEDETGEPHDDCKYCIVNVGYEGEE